MADASQMGWVQVYTWGVAALLYITSSGQRRELAASKKRAHASKGGEAIGQGGISSSLRSQGHYGREVGKGAK